jgi:hypothetical protein
VNGYNLDGFGKPLPSLELTGYGGVEFTAGIPDNPPGDIQIEVKCYIDKQTARQLLEALGKVFHGDEM